MAAINLSKIIFLIVETWLKFVVSTGVPISLFYVPSQTHKEEFRKCSKKQT